MAYLNEGEGLDLWRTGRDKRYAQAVQIRSAPPPPNIIHPAIPSPQHPQPPQYRSHETIELSTTAGTQNRAAQMSCASVAAAGSLLT
jgi:hypothetical protein